MSVRICALLIAVSYCVAWPALGASRGDKPAAAPELTDDELKSITELLQKMAADFVSGDDKSVMKLFAPTADSRDRIATNLQSEFKQTRYLKFEIVQVQPEDTLRKNVHSVDVRLRTELIHRERHPDSQVPIKNATSESFVVKKMDDGNFLILHSPFFENLGMRQGMGMVVEGLLAVMALFALLAFWVWMGWEAWRTRPRQPLWRAIVCIPVAGALIYFLVRYLPATIRGAKSEPA